MEFKNKVDIYESYGVVDLESIGTFEICDEFKCLYKELSKQIQNFNNKIENFKIIVNNSNLLVKKTFERNVNKINLAIKKYHIPYKIVPTKVQNVIKSYNLVLINDINNLNRVSAMSTGEKNLVSFIIFCYYVKKMNPSLVFIDDPISNYDEFKRNGTIDLMKNILTETTTIVLSHDLIFPKLILSNKYYKPNILFMQNHDSVHKLMKIDENDFGGYTEFIQNRINNLTSYYNKIINLRLLLESNKKGWINNLLYTFFSAVLHRKEYDLINNELEAYLTKEEVIKKLNFHTTNLTNVEKINELHKFIIKEIKSRYLIKISILKKDYLNNDNNENLTFFEKCIICREMNFSEDESHIKSELSSLVHCNAALYITLNPYKYSYCSLETTKFVNDKFYNLFIDSSKKL